MEKQVRTVKIENDAQGWSYTFKMSDQGIQVQPTYFAGVNMNRFLSGALRHNVRGFRIVISLNWEASLEADNFRDFWEDLSTSLFVDADPFIRFYPNAENDDYLGVILSSQNALVDSYRSTVGRFQPTLGFISRDIFEEIPEFIDFREGPSDFIEVDWCDFPLGDVDPLEFTEATGGGRWEFDTVGSLSGFPSNPCDRALRETNFTSSFDRRLTWIGGPSVTDVEVICDLSIGNLSSNSRMFASLSIDSQNWYRFGMRAGDTIEIGKFISGSFTQLGSIPISVPTGQTGPYWVHFLKQEGSLKMKLWYWENPEPGDWQIEVEDSDLNETFFGFDKRLGGFTNRNFKYREL